VRIASSQTGLTGSVIAVVLDGAAKAAQRPLRLRTFKDFKEPGSDSGHCRTKR